MCQFSGKREWHHAMGWMGLVFGAVYWILESFMDTYVYDLGPFMERLFHPDLNELVMRLLAVGLIGALGLYAQIMLDRLSRIQKRFARMNECFLNFGPDPVANIDRLTALCGEMLGADAAHYNRLDQGKFCSWGHWQWPYECDLGENPDEHICSKVLKQNSKEPLLIRNLPSSSFSSIERGLIRHGFRTYLGKAVQLGDKSVGTLCVVYRKDFVPTDEDRGVLGILASAISVEEVRRQAENALRVSESRMKELSAQLLVTQETERKRIALQMHDSIGQSLSAIKFSIEETLEAARETLSGEKLRPLETAVPLIQGVVNEVRRIQRNLRPAMLDDLGILATLAWFCRDFQSIYGGIAVDLEMDIEEDEIPEPLKIVVFRIVQEAFNNVAKHSKAAHVALSLHRTAAEGIELSIEDNGQGFDVYEYLSSADLRGLGLSSMRERAELSGGAIRIESVPGQGTRIKAVWGDGSETSSRPESAPGASP
ncbi:MAG: sensor histidine kinase [Syntrophobacteraceae bacterium]